MVLYGCSNVRFVQPREGCRRGVGPFIWDVCEDIKDPVAKPRLKIKGDENIYSVEQPEFDEVEEFEVKI